MANDFNNFGDLLSYVNKALGKDIQGEYISPDDITLATNEVQIELLNDYIESFETTREHTFDTAPFMKTYGDDEFPPLQLNSYGKVAIPSDIFYSTRINYTKYMNVGCTTTSQYQSITLLTQMDFDGYMNTPMYNPLLNPKEVNPIAVIQNGKILVVPNVKAIRFSGFKKPVNVYFDFDILNGEIVYLPPGQVHANSDAGPPAGSPSLSVEPEWPIQVWPELGHRLIKYFAVNQRSAFNIQVAEEKKI